MEQNLIKVVEMSGPTACIPKRKRKGKENTNFKFLERQKESLKELPKRDNGLHICKIAFL